MSWLILLFLLPTGWVVWWWMKPRPWLRHQRCLENIERLERELFPEWFKAEKVDWMDGFTFAPGAVWPVESHNYVQRYPSGQMKADLAARNLAFSAEMKRAEIHQQFWGTAP